MLTKGIGSFEILSLTTPLICAKIEKLQPTVPSERPEEYYYQYKDGEPVLDEKGKKEGE